MLKQNFSELPKIVQVCFALLLAHFNLEECVTRLLDLIVAANEFLPVKAAELGHPEAHFHWFECLRNIFAGQPNLVLSGLTDSVADFSVHFCDQVTPTLLLLTPSHLPLGNESLLFVVNSISGEAVKVVKQHFGVYDHPITYQTLRAELLLYPVRQQVDLIPIVEND